MKNKKLFYLGIVKAFMAGLITYNKFRADQLQISCGSISTELFKKKISKPYLREIDVLKVIIPNKVFFVQSNDENLVSEIQRDLDSCSGYYILNYYKNEVRNGDHIYFVTKPFFD